MSGSHTKATVRMVAASFAAGASAMVLFGLVAPVAVQGGLSVRDAIAMPETDAQLIEPLDVAAIEAQLAQAELGQLHGSSSSPSSFRASCSSLSASSLVSVSLAFSLGAMRW